MTSNQEKIDSAIQFLSDTGVKSQPLSQKLSFLESKGLSADEIQQVLALTSSAPAVPNSQMQLYPPPPPPRPLPSAYDWKDYLIMSTTTVGFLYGAYHVVANHILPSIMPPSKTKLDEDKEAMDREFERVDAMLNKLEADQREFIDSQNEKSKAIDDTLVQLSALIKDTNERNLRNDETLKYLKLEVESIKTTLLKNLESQKETISGELQALSKATSDIKQDLQTQSKYFPIDPLSSVDKLTSPPPNLLTNKSYDDSSVSPIQTAPEKPNQSEMKYNLNIPPTSSIPSTKDILKDTYKVNSEADLKPVEAGIPAWQKTEKHAVNNTSIPAWQLAAEQDK